MNIKIALAGNPNCGKTTLFNSLTGANQYVGNWPGVTVEKKEGKLKGYKDVIIQDLPGIYSLSPYTLEEVVARNYLVKEQPDAILNIVDGTNIERNLYLTTQLIELGLPVVVAVNMIDLVRKNGDQIDLKKLGDSLGCLVVERYAYINGVVSGAVKKKAAKGSLSISDRIDQIVTNRILALPIFAVIMYLIYTIAMGTSIVDGGIGIGTFGTDWANDTLFGEIVPGWFDVILGALGVVEGTWVYGLIQDGIMAGVGAVLGFVPQMLVLFLLPEP